jgi:glucose-6-phosphate isomerase
MKISKQELWQRFQQYYTEFPDLDLALDMSRMNFPDGFFETMAPRMQKAFSDMAALERGEIANPDEKRMVGHYWLRPRTGPHHGNPRRDRQYRQCHQGIRGGCP